MYSSIYTYIYTVKNKSFLFTTVASALPLPNTTTFLSSLKFLGMFKHVHMGIYSFKFLLPK